MHMHGHEASSAPCKPVCRRENQPITASCLVYFRSRLQGSHPLAIALVTPRDATVLISYSKLSFIGGGGLTPLLVFCCRNILVSALPTIVSLKPPQDECLLHRFLLNVKQVAVLLARLKHDRILLWAEKHDFRGAFETPYTPRFDPDENEAVSLVH